ncbi:MAG: hypothetical protein JKY98_08610 [Gammaproteobacteria bacterium]|nr:hypothetical protein [Gammaproteobacteria bacterium]
MAVFLYLNDRSSNIKKLIGVFVLFAGFLLIGSASAQEGFEDAVEIERDAEELSDLLTGKPNPHPEAASMLDTAMVLTNVARVPTVARCWANDSNGNTVGRVRVPIPGSGVRFFLASDIIEDSGFVGSVICSAGKLVIGTGIMLGVVTTSIEVHQDYKSRRSIIVFPIAAMR